MSISAHNYNYYTEWQTWRTAVFECTAALSYSETVVPSLKADWIEFIWVTCIPPPHSCNAPMGLGWAARHKRMGRGLMIVFFTYLLFRVHPVRRTILHVAC